MFMFSRKDPKQPAGARGYRAYVVGDVHGRLDLLEALLDRIHGDIANREPIEVVGEAPQCGIAAVLKTPHETAKFFQVLAGLQRTGRGELVGVG